MKRNKRFWKIFVIVIVLVIICLVGLQIVISPLAEKIISKKVEPFFGDQLKIGSIDISIFRGSVIIKNVELLQPPGFMANNFLQIKTIKVKISILPLLKKQLVVNGITILQPEINLVQLKNGETNITYYLSKIKKTSNPPSSNSSESSSPLNFHLDKLSIQKGEIALYSYKMCSKQPTFLIKNFNFDLRNVNIPNDKNIPSQFNISGIIASSNPATIKSNGEGVFLGGPISFKAKTKIEKISLGDFLYLYPDIPVMIKEGQVWVDSDAECKKNYLISKQHVEIKNLKIDSKGGFVKKTLLGLPANGFVKFLEDKNGYLNFDFEISGNLNNLKINIKETIEQAVAKSIKDKIGSNVIETAEKLGENLKKTGEKAGKSIKNVFDFKEKKK
ncbi:MAG TPA: AsmA family protein [Candidatus Ratteibacteria bacterium]|nr:AsmA family protein [Candidatus Ratteibacteria bacterium]